ncbi:MAG TPA: hypothetical protein DDY14_10555, partial [Chromatiaceae bacterium]|nr:hypothetical protein [Chromatiaceae bacterium]
MSGLRERLRRLQSVPQPDPSPIQNPAPGFSVAERLRRLDPLRHRAANPCTPCEQDVAAELGAEIVAPGVLLLERRHPLRRRHGRFRAADAPASMPALFPSPSTGAAGWAFIDTETSGLAGGTGTWAFVCGIGRFAGDDLLLRQWLLTRLDAEPVLLSLFADCLNGVDLLISYNGKSFDLPLLMTRFRLAGLHCPLEPLSHLDLLHPVRRAFATRWPNCRLASVEQRLLGVQRGDDLP